MNTSETAGLMALMLVPLLIAIPLAVFIIITMWKLFVKAGQPGWAALIPLYNTYIMLKIAGKPGWWLVLFFVPVVNIVIGIMTIIEIAKAFGQSGGFAVLLILLPIVGYPILAFGDSKYTGPAAAT